MSQLEEFWKPFDGDEARLNEYIERVTRLASTLAFAQEKSDEMKAMRRTLKSLPEEVLAEMIPRLLATRKVEEADLRRSMPVVVNPTNEQMNYFAYSSTASGSTAAVVELTTITRSEYPWLGQAIQPIIELVDQ